MSGYTCTYQLTILRHFLKKILHVIYAPKPIARTGCDTSIIFM